MNNEEINCFECGHRINCHYLENCGFRIGGKADAYCSCNITPQEITNYELQKAREDVYKRWYKHIEECHGDKYGEDCLQAFMRLVKEDKAIIKGYNTESAGNNLKVTRNRSEKDE